MANIFDDFTLEECRAMRKEAALRVFENTKSASHNRTGSMAYGAIERDEENIKLLTQRICELTGEPDPYAGVSIIKFIALNPGIHR